MICRRHIRTYKGELLDVLRAIFDKRGFISYLDLFEQEFARYVKRKHAVAVCSGREGLELLLEAYGIGRGDEVIFPAYTLKDLIILVAAKDIKPVLVDIDENTFNINVDLIEEKITPKTKAIIATHIFGAPCDIKRIMTIAKRHNLIVIEDCAHSLGSEIEGKKTGSFGDVAFFSFELTKSVNTYGGGIIVVDNDRIAAYLRAKIETFPYVSSKVYQKIFSAYFEKIFVKTLFFDMFTLMFYFNFSTKIINTIYRFIQRRGRIKHTKFTGLQAFIGLKKLRLFDELNHTRIDKARTMADYLNYKIGIQQNEKDAFGNFYFFVIRFRDYNNANNLRKWLIRNQIDVGIESEIADDCSQVLKDYYLPVANKIYRCLIQIPLHENLTNKKIIYIAGACNKISSMISDKSSR